MSVVVSDHSVDRIALTFRLLGDPTRLAVIRALLSGEEKNVGRLVEETGQSQSNVSKHLKHLTRAGMLERRKFGLHVFYRLADPMVERLYRIAEASREPRFARQSSRGDS
jgi:ArsR family transcriptional regulator